MKINKLKALSIAVCCLVVSIWSATPGMDEQPDIDEGASRRPYRCDCIIVTSKSPTQRLGILHPEKRYATYVDCNNECLFECASMVKERPLPFYLYNTLAFCENTGAWPKAPQHERLWGDAVK